MRFGGHLFLFAVGSVAVCGGPLKAVGGEAVPLDDGRARGEYEDFVTGFVTPEGSVWGRPVGVTVAKDGSLIFSEAAHGIIWRVTVTR